MTMLLRILTHIVLKEDPAIISRYKQIPIERVFSQC